MRSYGHVWLRGGAPVVDSDSGDFRVTLDHNNVFHLNFDRDMQKAVITTGTSVPYIDAPYFIVKAIGADASSPRQIQVGLIRMGGSGTQPPDGFGFWFMVVDSGNHGSDANAGSDHGSKETDGRTSKSTNASASAHGEWDPNEKEQKSQITYRACFVNRTYSPLNLTIVRPGGSTAIPLAAGAHYRGWLFKGPAVFVSSDSITGRIIAHMQHDVAGETTVTLSPSDITFTRGVQACLEHDDGERKE